MWDTGIILAVVCVAAASQLLVTQWESPSNQPTNIKSRMASAKVNLCSALWVEDDSDDIEG